MCSECHKVPCDPRCPNADDPVQVTHCELCGDPIYEGELYYNIKDSTICTDCVDKSLRVASIE